MKDATHATHTPTITSAASSEYRCVRPSCMTCGCAASFRHRTKSTADATHAHEHMRSSQKQCANSCNFDARECVTRETPEKNIPCASQASPQENQPARSRPHHQCCFSQAPTFSMTDSPCDIPCDNPIWGANRKEHDILSDHNTGCQMNFTHFYIDERATMSHGRSSLPVVSVRCIVK